MKRARSEYSILREKIEEAKQEIVDTVAEEYMNSEEFGKDLENECRRIFASLVNSKESIDALKKDLFDEMHAEAKAKVDKEYKDKAEAAVRDLKPAEKLTPAANPLPPFVYQ